MMKTNQVFPKKQSISHWVKVAVIGISATFSGLAQSAPIQVGGNVTIALPSDWRITSQNANPASATESIPGVNHAATLLLTARPIDAQRSLSISLFQINSPGAAPSAPVGPHGQQQGSQAEIERLLQTVLSVGFSPKAVKTSYLNSSRSAPLLTVEVTAQNADGVERLFTDTALFVPGSVIRLCSARLTSDQAGAKDLDDIIQSLGVKGKIGTSSSAGDSDSWGLSQGAEAAPSPSIETSAKAAQLVQEYSGALMLVEGKKGVGSGFLCAIGGTTFAFTNAHVLSGNSSVKLTNLNGTSLAVTTGAIAVGHDIVKMEMTGKPKSFELMPSLDTNLKIGDTVVVLGNAEGASVVKPVMGKVVGIGPDLVEVDAPFVSGNSGSPIVHEATGKVVGIATYLLQRKVKAGPNTTVTVQTRRFGYRIDNVRAWEPLNWQRFFAQAAQVEKIEALSEGFIRLAQAERLDPADYANSDLQRPVENYLATRNQGRYLTMSAADKRATALRFFADVRNATRKDITAFDSVNAYDYFRRAVEEQNKFRTEIYDSLSSRIDMKSN